MKPFVILHIEDDSTTSKIYKELLIQDKDKLTGNSQQPIEVIIVSNWVDAEHELKKVDRFFDLIIYDLRFPNLPEEVGVKGKDRYQDDRLPEVRKLQPSAAIAIATSYAYENHLEVCVDVIAKGLSDEFIPKDLAWSGILLRIVRARTIKKMRDIVAEPYQANIARTVAEDIAARVSTFESRIRLVIHGTDLEESLRTELQQLRHNIEESTSYLVNRSNARPEELSLSALVDEVRGHYEGQTGHMLNCSGSCGDTFRTYREDLQVALRAIVQNSIDAVKDMGSAIAENAVRIEASREGRLVHISVIDRGPGFAPDAISGLFSPGQSFWVRDRGRHKGLGLYVSRRRLYSIGGDISVPKRDISAGETSITLTVPDWEAGR